MDILPFSLVRAERQHHKKHVLDNTQDHKTSKMLALLQLTPLVLVASTPQPTHTIPNARHTPTPNMQLNKKVVSFDQDGLFEGREVSIEKSPVRLLERLEELELLTGLANAGVLSSAEDSGLFSKLEAARAFSSPETLPALADKLKLLSTVEGLLNVEAWKLSALAVFLLAGEAGIVLTVPDDNAALIGVQALTGVAAGAGAVTLLGLSYFLSLLQGDD